eukprot:2551169-Amphidinium_carterae.1
MPLLEMFHYLPPPCLNKPLKDEAIMRVQGPRLKSFRSSHGLRGANEYLIDTAFCSNGMMLLFGPFARRT